MIDTISIRIHQAASTENLTKFHNISDEDGNHIITSGWLDNLRITINPNDDTTIVKGSIRKYFFGPTALDELGHMEISEVIGRLSENLGVSRVDIDQADLLRLDIGQTFQVDKPVKAIYDRIAGHPRLKQMQEYRGSLQFSGANKKIIFYDKIAEIQKNEGKKVDITFNGEPIDPSSNWLRFEVQYKKVSGLRDQLKDINAFGDVISPQPIRQDAPVPELAERQSQFNALQDILKREFDRVKFELTEALQAPQEFNSKYMVVLVALLKTNELRAIYSLLDSWGKDDTVSKDILYNLKRDIRELTGSSTSEAVDEKKLLSELLSTSLEDDLTSDLDRLFDFFKG